VLVLEVLVGELVTVDGLATGTLFNRHSLAVEPQGKQLTKGRVGGVAYVVAGEVTTLEHELGDHTVEAGVLVTLALGQLAELTEVLGGLRDILLVEVEVDTANLG